MMLRKPNVFLCTFISEINDVACGAPGAGGENTPRERLTKRESLTESD
jgi:hypothetical protein